METLVKEKNLPATRGMLRAVHDAFKAELRNERINLESKIAEYKKDTALTLMIVEEAKISLEIQTADNRIVLDGLATYRESHKNLLEELNNMKNTLRLLAASKVTKKG